MAEFPGFVTSALSPTVLTTTALKPLDSYLMQSYRQNLILGGAISSWSEPNTSARVWQEPFSLRSWTRHASIYQASDASNCCVSTRDRQREMVTRLLCLQQLMKTYVVLFPCHNQVSRFCDPLGPCLYPAWVYTKRIQDHTLAVGRLAAARL